MRTSTTIIIATAALLALITTSGCPRRYVEGPFCGNEVCEAGESETTCPGDCGFTPGWSCDPNFYGADDGCDCGCSVSDPDCGALGCTTPGCSVTGCDYCYDSAGVSIGCNPGGGVCGDGVCDAGEASTCKADCGAAGWLCDMAYYGTSDGCDCGCGIPDPDCSGLGCSAPGCSDSACEYCWDKGPVQITCGGGPPMMCPNNNCADLGGTYVCDTATGTCVCASGCQPFGSSVCCGFPFCAGDCIGNPCC